MASTVRVLAIDGEMTLSRAAELKAQVVEALSGGQPIQLDLAAVSEIDTAGVQLLLLARQLAEQQGLTLAWGPPNPVVDEALRFLRLEEVRA